MIIRHQLFEVETGDGLYWCEICLMSFRAHAKPKKGHAWNLAIRNLAGVRNKGKDYLPRPKFRSDHAT